MRFHSEGAVRFLAAASARRSSIESDWARTQRELQALWPRRGHTVVALIHEGDQGLTAEEATDVLDTLYHLDPAAPVDVILHSHGGSATAANRVAAALVDRPNTASFVPFYAESAGTEVALATEQIFLGKDANLSPIDIQIEGTPARDIVKLVQQIGHRASEGLLLAAKVAKRALRDEAKTVDALINARHKQNNLGLAKRLTSGQSYHSELIRLADAKGLGLNVAAGVPDMLYGFIGKRRAQLRQLNELESQIKFIHRREPEPVMASPEHATAH